MKLTDDEIIKIAFVTALIGILFLLVLSKNIKANNKEIFTMMSNKNNGVVKIQARVIGVAYSNYKTKIRLSFNTNLTAITKKHVRIKRGDEVIVSGYLSKNILFINSMEEIK